MPINTCWSLCIHSFLVSRHVHYLLCRKHVCRVHAYMRAGGSDERVPLTVDTFFRVHAELSWFLRVSSDVSTRSIYTYSLSIHHFITHLIDLKAIKGVICVNSSLYPYPKPFVKPFSAHERYLKAGHRFGRFTRNTEDPTR